MTLNKTLRYALTLASLTLSMASFAHDDKHGDEVITLLQKQSLADASGKSGVMLTVAYGPGESSIPHLHPGSIFAYVLEGEVISQLEGQAPVRYKTGESWYEPPSTPHLISKNASPTKPAKLLVWSLVEDGKQVTVPLSK
ncbi:Cupin domain protein [Collimonas sp. OK307]|uniref:cupin domain-containing protein n=1 Tax=Collimonas sp. OK307 TaxID=1801620 RepID=UPI0008F41A29|nr:cupin domain-containing protein [Collimonas sp. OK307]SFI32183.1 Cupin domain protein [Collimonas sp. OK307]